ALQCRDQFLDRPAADDLLSLATSPHETIDLRRGPVEHGDGVAMTLDIEDQVLAHHGKPDQSDVGSRGWSVHVHGRRAPACRWVWLRGWEPARRVLLPDRRIVPRRGAFFTCFSFPRPLRGRRFCPTAPKSGGFRADCAIGTGAIHDSEE